MVLYKRISAISIILLIFLTFTHSSSIFIRADTLTNSGQLNVHSSDLSKGYTLFSPIYTDITYLTDINGTIVHTWEPEYRPGQASYLLENGNLLYTTFRGLHTIFIAGGMGGGIQKIAWNGTVLWDFTYNGETYLSHHDIELLPNGNILLIAWEYKTYEECIAAGRNPTLLPLAGLWPDHIIEVEPTSPTTADIIWEWHIWNHLIQDFDPTKDNYGVVSDHPERIDINCVENQNLLLSDWTHTNSIDYHESYDQILISVSKFSEIWVIDHSTTTEEATGHTGGRYGKGGDLLYRWGNPQTYNQGQPTDQQFFNQHDAQWIQSGFPGEGNILVFNNGNTRSDEPYSTVDEITPPIDSTGSYYLAPNTSYEPLQPIWTYTAQNPTDFYSSIVSGIQRFPNGNTLICSGEHGIFFEISDEKEVIWEYTNPYPRLLRNTVFKTHRYSPDYPGLSDLYHRPAKPSAPTGPILGKSGSEYSFSTYTTDPDGDTLYYLIDWGDNTTSDWLGPYNSTEKIHISHIWNSDDNFQIHVKAKDSNNSESNWSDSTTVTIYKNIINLFILLLERILTRIVESIIY